MAQQLWVTDTLGGFMGNAKLSRELRHAAEPMMKFRQFCRIKEEFGKNKNDTIYFDKISKISTAGGTLIETDTMPRRNFKVVRGTATITEFGNAIPYSGKLEALAEFDVDNSTTKVLRNDQASVIDNAVADQFQASLAKYVCLSASSTALTTNGTATKTSTSNLNDYHIKNIVDQLKKWDVPPYDSEGNYICIGSVTALRGVRDDTNFLQALRYGKPENLFTGEIGKYGGVRFIEETNALSNAIGITSSYGEAVFFGDDAVLEAVAIPEEVRYDVPKDFGRNKAIAWYGLLGFQIIWCGTGSNEGGSTATVDTALGFVPHIIHVTSA